MGVAQSQLDVKGDVLLPQDAGPDGVVDVMVDIGDAVGHADDPAFRRVGHFGAGVAQDAVQHLPRQVEAPALLFQKAHHPEALLVVVEGHPSGGGKGTLTGVAEGGVAQVVTQGDGLGQILVEPQGPCHRPGDLRHLQRVGQPGAVMVPLGGQEHLGLVLEAAEGLGVDDPVPVPHEAGAHRVGSLLPLSAQRGVGKGGPGAQDVMFTLFNALPQGHAPTSRWIFRLFNI